MTSYPFHLAFFGLGGVEWLLVLLVGLLVIGPKDLPPLVRGVMALWRRLQLMAHEFQTSFEDMANEMDAKKHANEIKKKIMNATGLDDKLDDELDDAMTGAVAEARDSKELIEVKMLAPNHPLANKKIKKTGKGKQGMRAKKTRRLSISKE